MENRIDIKDFKAVTKFTFLEGMFKKVEKRLEGKELEFYNLDKDNIEKMIKEENIDAKDNILFLFKLIPVLSNVDMTIEKEEFEKMCKVPSLQFANYVDLLMDHIKTMFTTAKKLISMEDKIKDFAIENDIKLEVDSVE